jgi:hypothetical protein
MLRPMSNVGSGDAAAQQSECPNGGYVPPRVTKGDHGSQLYSDRYLRVADVRYRRSELP